MSILAKSKKKAISLFTATILCAMSFMPGSFSVMAKEPVKGQDISTAVENNVQPVKKFTKEQAKEMLSGCDYAEGEVIVVLNDAKVADEASIHEAGAGESDLLSKASPIMDISAEAYEECLIEGATDEAKITEVDSKEGVSIAVIKDPSKTTEELITELMNDPRVISAEPNYIYKVAEEGKMSLASDEIEVIAKEDAADEIKTIAEENSANEAEIQAKSSLRTVTPLNPTKGYDSAKTINDMSSFQWGYKNDGSTLGRTDSCKDGYDINPDNWNDLSKKNATGVVVIMDSGIDYNNPDLKDVMYELPADIIAKVGGGKYGISTADGDPAEIMDKLSHGTHVAGIVAAQWNGQGVSGAANGCKLLGVRVMEHERGIIAASSLLNGYAYIMRLVDAGIPVNTVNLSIGAPEATSVSEKLATEQLGLRGVITVIASANDGADNDKVAHTANLFKDTPFSIVVNASTPSAEKASYSDYGECTTDIFAPGSDILSTMPIENKSYFPEGDTDPIFYSGDATDGKIIVSTLDGRLGNVQSAEDITSGGNLAKVKNDLGFVNGNCLELNLEEGTSKSRSWGATGEFLAYLPVKTEDLDKLSYLSFEACYEGDPGEYYYMGAAVMATDGEGIVIINKYGLEYMYEKEWNRFSHTIRDICPEGYELLVIDYGDPSVSYVPIVFQIGEDNAEEIKGTLYLDNIGIGKADAAIPYGYMQGTSMATPAVTGCDAILAKRQSSQGKEFNTKKAALERANILRGSVRQDETIDQSLCRQGGTIDLSVDPSDYVPVVNYLDVDTWQYRDYLDVDTWQDSRIASLKGAFFKNDKGTVTIGGKDAEIISWSDDEIVCKIPAGTANGMNLVCVTDKNGVCGKNGFLIDGSNSGSDVDYFEKNIELPNDREVRENASQPVMCGVGDKLFFMFNDQAREVYYYKNIWMYDEHGLWTKVASLPNEVAYVSMTEYQNKLAICGSTEEVQSNGKQVYTSQLYILDIQTGELKAVEKSAKSQELLSGYGICNVNGHLVAVGGGFYQEDPETNQKALHTEGIPITEVTIKNNSYTTKKLGEYKENGAYLFNDNVSASGNVLYAQAWSMVNGKEIPHILEIIFSNTKKLKIGSMKELPFKEQSFAIDKGYSNSKYAFTACADGLIMTGLYLNDESGKVQNADTFLWGHNQDTLGNFGKKAFKDIMENPSCLAYNGMLYVTSASYNASPTLQIHATRANTASTVVAGITMADKTAVYTGKRISVKKPKAFGTKGKVQVTYYTDAECTQVTTPGNGALKDGYAPSKVGEYYVKAEVPAVKTSTAASAVARLAIVHKPTVLKKKYTSDNRSVTVSYTKGGKLCSGYYILCSKDSSFDSNKADVIECEVDGLKKTKATIEDLDANTTYYVCACTVNTDNGEKVYSDWSDTIEVKTKP